jgi:Helix-turn-helix domain
LDVRYKNIAKIYLKSQESRTNAMYTPGTLLRLAREERKISLAETKSIVKIRETALYAMETDQFDKFPAQYMQTFLPEYADFLGVPQKKLAEAFTHTLPEYEYLARSLYSRSLQRYAQEEINERWQANNPTLMQSAARFVRSNARKGAVVAVACCLVWFVFGSGASLIGTMFANVFASAIVATPEDMRGTPFTELNAPANPQKRFSTITLDKEKLDQKQLETMKRESETDANTMDAANSNMTVISLASVIPLQKEMQSALLEGFEYVMKDEKAEARKRVKTSVASVSFSSAKANLEAESKNMFFTPDMEENERERPEERVVTSEATIETIRKNADAASARIGLMVQTRIKTEFVGKIENYHSLSSLRTSRIIAEIEYVELQQLPMMHITGLDASQAFAPVQMPPELTNGYLYNLQAGTAQN